MLKKNDELELLITGTTHDGSGVGRHEGFALFVPGAIEGERVQVRVLKLLKNYGFARLLAVLEPSPDRIDSDCSLWPRCGGCVYRQMTYRKELSIKTAAVESCLKKGAGMERTLPPCLPSPRREGYRNKCQLPVGLDREGRVVCGYYGKNSHRIVPLQSCSLHPPVFDRIAACFCRFLESHKISVYSEENQRGLVRHLCLRLAQKTGQIMVTVVINGERLPHSGQLVDALTRQFPDIRSIYLNHNRRATNVIMGQACTLLWGEERIVDELCGIRLALSPLSFYQVNRDAAETLYTLAAKMAQLSREDVLLDLYCGVGSIGLTMAGQVKEVYGVEVVPAAVEDARKNAALNGIENAQFFCGDCKDAVDYFAQNGISPTAVVLDPPRKGCDVHVIDEVARLAPDRVVMISCNPATMARDVALFAERGYAAQQIQPVDLFPRTAHVETVVLLTQNSQGAK